MKSEDKTPLPKVRIAVLGNENVGKSGKHAEEFMVHTQSKKKKFV